MRGIRRQTWSPGGPAASTPAAAKPGFLPETFRETTARCGRGACRLGARTWQAHMDLENRTPLEAALFRGDLPGGEKTLAVLVAKASAVVGVGGQMELDL